MFYVQAVTNVDEVSQTMDIQAWLNLTWHDQIRVWNPEHFGHETLVTPYFSEIWHPKFFIITSTHKMGMSEEEMPGYLYHTGKTEWSPILTFTNYCSMDFTFFPFDNQTCMIIFIFRSKDRHLIPIESTDNYYNRISTNGEWDFGHITMRSDVYPSTDIEACLAVYIPMKRRPHLFIGKILVPIALISGLSALVFLLPEEGGERASYSTTMLLTLILDMSYVSESLPEKTDNFPIILIYIFLLLGLSSLSVLTTVLQIYLSTRPGQTPLSEDLVENVTKSCECVQKVKGQQSKVKSTRSYDVTEKEVNWCRGFNINVLYFILYVTLWLSINVVAVSYWLHHYYNSIVE